VAGSIGSKLNTDVGECYGVAKRDEISGFLGRLYSSDSGNAKDIPFFMTARLNELIGVRIHLNPASRNRYPVGRSFIANIDHMRLATGIKMRQFVHIRGFTIST
jgi:hypothetical protein